MAAPSTLPAGSVGNVETRFLDLPAPLSLDCGRELPSVRVAYETYGTLSPTRDNVILVCHALSGDAHAAGFSTTPAAAGTRDGFAAERRDGAAGRALGWWDPASKRSRIARNPAAPPPSRSTGTEFHERNNAPIPGKRKSDSRAR
jgi:hypothetical protein